MDKKKNILRGVLSGIKKTAKYVASSPVNAYKNVAAAISIPYYVAKGNKAARQAGIIKTARAYDSAPNLVDGKPTDAMKMRQSAEEIINPIGTKNPRRGVNARSLGLTR